MITNLASSSFFEDILLPMIVLALGLLFVRLRSNRKLKARKLITQQEKRINPGLNLYVSARDFFVRYPAVLLGYIIYSYLFISTIKFFLDGKNGPLGAFDIFLRFDSVLWMWLLAVALVKIIEIRTKLHTREKDRLVQHQELEVRQMQLRTLVETVRGLQHEVNNPLAIIMMSAGRLERQLSIGEESRKVARTISSATNRIAITLEAFTRAKRYEVDNSPVGQLAKPPALSDSPEN